MMLCYYRQNKHMEYIYFLELFRFISHQGLHRAKIYKRGVKFLQQSSQIRIKKNKIERKQYKYKEITDK